MPRTPRQRRQYAMTSTNQQPPLGQEAAVAVLQTTTRHLEERVSELVKSSNDGLALIATKLDEISKQSALIAQLAAEQQSHSRGLERAFGDIKAAEAKFLGEVARVDQRVETNTAAINEIKGRVAFAKGGLYVLGSVGALVIALLVWALTPTLNTARENADDIKQLELNEMKYHPKP